MRCWIVVVFLLISSNLFAQKSWNSLTKDRTYKTNRVISLFLDEREFIFKIDTSLKLNDVIKDDFIKVYIHKFSVTPCPGASIESDLELVEVKQPNGSSNSVGVNLGRGCNLEVFVDMSEYKAISFLK